MSYRIRYRLLATFVVAFVVWILPRPLFQPKVAAFDLEDEVVIRMATGVGNGTGTFGWLDNAIDDYWYTGSVGSVAAGCSTTCTNEVQQQGVWQGFPDGFEPLRLEVHWDSNGGLGLDVDRGSRVDLILEYDTGSGWEIGEQETWINQIPSCSETYKSRCGEHVYVKELDPEMSSAALKVRATIKGKMTVCGNCGWFDWSNLSAQMAVRNIQLVARIPRLVANPGPTLTRGVSSTLSVEGAPISTYANWRYESAGRPAITRSTNVNDSTWSGPILVGGTAKVTVTVPGQSQSMTLERPLTVDPRSWNSTPKTPVEDPSVVPPPGFQNPPTLASYQSSRLGYAGWYLIGTYEATKLGGDGPNQGLSYVTSVQHDTASGMFFKYALNPGLTLGETFYQRQCGTGGIILGSVLRSYTLEHEMGTLMGHYKRYIDKLAEPSTNYAKYAENLIGEVSESEITFKNRVTVAFATRASDLSDAAASSDALDCNVETNKSPSCASGGTINFFPYQPPCQ